MTSACNSLTSSQNVVANLRRSFEEKPRKMYVIFPNNDHFDKVVEKQPWVKKTYQTTFYPQITCGVHEVNSASLNA